MVRPSERPRMTMTQYWRYEEPVAGRPDRFSPINTLTEPVRLTSAAGSPSRQPSRQSQALDHCLAC